MQGRAHPGTSASLFSPGCFWSSLELGDHGCHGCKHWLEGCLVLLSVSLNQWLAGRLG